MSEIKKLTAFFILFSLFSAVMPALGTSFEKMGDQQFLDICRDGTEQEILDAINKGANVNAKNNNGTTALILAVINGHVATVSALLKAGADVNAKAKYGITALMFAARYCGSPEVINMLIDAGADDAVTDYGETALMLAAEKNTPEVVEALINAGAYVKARDNEGKTVLDYANDNDKLKGTKTLERLENLCR